MPAPRAFDAAEKISDQADVLDAGRAVRVLVGESPRIGPGTRALVLSLEGEAMADAPYARLVVAVTLLGAVGNG